MEELYEASNQPQGSGGNSEQILSRLSSQLRPYLDAADALKADKSNRAVNYPSIVVIGDQCEGKSTVLEAISGVQLPKATSLCTRCPIQLCLREGDEKTVINYRLGSSLRAKKISRNDIEREISSAQEHILPSTSELEITDETISVLIQTPHGFNLTLIDLPGINRDTSDIEEKTVKIIERYIESEQTIITVVFKCTTDVKTVKAFQLAKKFDPQGKRTIGVISHCDTLSENWEEAISKLVSSQSGVFIPVACRDFISGGTSAEVNVLSQRAVFRRMDTKRYGTQHLIVRLQEEVLKKLKPWINEIAWLVKRKRIEHQNQLNDLLEGEPTEAADSRKVACELLKKFAQYFEEQAKGEHRTEKNVLFSECERKWDEFEQSIRQLTEPNEKNDEMLKQSVKVEFKDQRGCEFKQVAHVFPVLRRIVRSLVNNEYRPKTMDVFEKICTAVTVYMNHLADEMFRLYPAFRDYIKERLSKKMAAITTDARKWLDGLLEMEATCVQTRRRHFNQNGAAADEIPQSIRQDMDEKEQLVYVLLTKYLPILADQTVDNVAKTIQYQLNHKLSKEIDSIHTFLPESDTLHGLMKNPEKEDKIRQVRQQLKFWSNLDDKLTQQASEYNRESRA